MKYCPECNRQYAEPWVTFCSDDGKLLIEQLSAPADPNWNPKIRATETPFEQETQWLPRDPPMAGGWVAPDERPPMTPVWQAPPPPPLPVSQPSQGMAVASMITGILGLVIGCFGPLPGIAAVALGWAALAQIKKSPQANSGKPLAIIGIITGGLTIAFYGLIIVGWILFGALSNF